MLYYVWIEHHNISLSFGITTPIFTNVYFLFRKQFPVLVLPRVKKARVTSVLMFTVKVKAQSGAHSISVMKYALYMYNYTQKLCKL